MTEEDKETIVQKAFVVDPKTGKVTETNRTIAPEQGISQAKKIKPRKEFESAHGVFENQGNVSRPLDEELEKKKEEERQRMRGRLLEEMRKLGLDKKNPRPVRKK